MNIKPHSQCQFELTPIRHTLTRDTLSQSDPRSSEALWLPARCWQTGSHRWAQAPQTSGCQGDAQMLSSFLRLTFSSALQLVILLPSSSCGRSVSPFVLISVSHKCQKFPDLANVCNLCCNNTTHPWCVHGSIVWLLCVVVGVEKQRCQEKVI